jgi:hypothetical protein
MALQDYVTWVFHSGDREARRAHGSEPAPVKCGSPVASPGSELQISGWKVVSHLMAKVIEFYIPNRYQKRVAWAPPQKRGKVIEFCSQVKKSA